MADQPRQGLRYQFRPLGYGPSADFFVYNSQYMVDHKSSVQNDAEVKEFTRAIDKFHVYSCEQSPHIPCLQQLQGLR
jgi:hypothetical protein